MDPSEFEDTVERAEHVVSAGALEKFFQSGKKTFAPPDLNEVIGGTYVLLYSLRETLEKVADEEEVERSMTLSDEQALRLAEAKEEYVGRRKALSAAVKGVLTSEVEPLLSQSTENRPREEVLTVVHSCKALVEQFKREYDFVVSLNKQAESAFLNVYRTCHSFPAVHRLLAECESRLELQQESLKKCQEQFSVANELLAGRTADATSNLQRNASTSGTDPSVDTLALTSSISLRDIVSTGSLVSREQQIRVQHDLEASLRQCKEEREAERQSHIAELVDLKNRFEMEKMSAEHAVKSKYEEQLLEQQQQFAASLAAKEEKAQFLAAELQNNRWKSVEFDDKLTQLENESKRRLQSEERVQALMLQLADLQNQFHFDRKALETQLQSEQEQLARCEERLQASNSKNEQLVNRLQSAEDNLRLRPEADVAPLLLSIGLSPQDSESGSWEHAQQQIVDLVRKLEREIVAIRRTDQDQQSEMQLLSSQLTEWQSKYQAKASELAVLEKDLWQAHEALKHRHQAHSNRQQSVATQKRANLTGRSTSGRHMNASLESLTFDEMNDLLVSAPAADSSAAAMVEPADGGTNSSSILQAVQHQRDRFMTSARELEAEVSDLKAKLNRMLEEQTGLRNDNLELYRQVRQFRMSAASNASKESHQWRNKRDEESSLSSRPVDDSKMQELDRKYLPSYESEMLSPFRLAEFERQQYSSKLSVADQVSAWIYRNIMQDPWARHAFLVYFALVHFLALFYVFQVLNPQLIEEVDAHLKAQWNEETLNLPEHPDV